MVISKISMVFPTIFSTSIFSEHLITLSFSIHHAQFLPLGFQQDFLLNVLIHAASLCKLILFQEFKHFLSPVTDQTFNPSTFEIFSCSFLIFIDLEVRSTDSKNSWVYNIPLTDLSNSSLRLSSLFTKSERNLPLGLEAVIVNLSNNSLSLHSV